MKMYWFCFENKKNTTVVYLSNDKFLLIDAIAKDHLHSIRFLVIDLNTLGESRKTIRYIFTSSLEYEHKVIR